MQYWDPGRVTAAERAVLVLATSKDASSHVILSQWGEGMKTVVMMVGKVSLLGKEKRNTYYLKKKKTQENGLKPLKSTLFFFFLNKLSSFQL